MYEYRQALVRMREGESDRGIAKTKLLSRTTARLLRNVAADKGWLDKNIALPNDEELAQTFNHARVKSSSGSQCKPFAVRLQYRKYF